MILPSRDEAAGASSVSVEMTDMLPCPGAEGKDSMADAGVDLPVLKASLQHGLSSNTVSAFERPCLAYDSEGAKWFIGYTSKGCLVPPRTDYVHGGATAARQPSLVRPRTSSDSNQQTQRSHTIVMPGKRKPVRHLFLNIRQATFALCLLCQFCVSLAYITGAGWKPEAQERTAKFALIRGFGSIDVQLPAHIELEWFALVNSLLGLAAFVSQSATALAGFSMMAILHLILYIPNAPSLASVFKLAPHILALVSGKLEEQRLSCGIISHVHVE